MIERVQERLQQDPDLSGEDYLEDLSDIERQLYFTLLDAVHELLLTGNSPYVSSAEELASDAMLEIYASEIIGLINIPSDKLEQKIQEIQQDRNSALAACPIGQVSCSTFSVNASTVYRATCGTTCLSASGFDRASNEECELGACDYRVWFYGRSSAISGIHGTTGAMNCLAQKAPHGRVYSINRTEVSFGFGDTTTCLIFSGGALVSNMRLTP